MAYFKYYATRETGRTEFFRTLFQNFVHMEAEDRNISHRAYEAGFFHVLKNLFVPRSLRLNDEFRRGQIVAIIPSFKPGKLSLRLVEDLIRYNKELLVCVVDDSTPEEHEAEHRIFEKIRNVSDKVVVLRTPENRLKAGAINQGIAHFLKKNEGDVEPEIVITLDDDVIISPNTISALVSDLLGDRKLGAVCSQCRVINKNSNFLTRLQSLEYFGFNASRVADDGFLYGPLVMHGMLTAFRIQALKDAGFFAERHLIEDYEITANMKKKGKWHVRLSPESYAWTKVPEKLSDLWRQRTRWNVGGLFVISQIRHWRAVLQDIIGHMLFLTTFILIILSIMFGGAPGSTSRIIIGIILILSLSQALAWYAFQVWFLKYYKEGDWKDYIIRIILVPEFLYANFLSVILLGSYIFFVFHSFFAWLEEKTKNHPLVAGTRRFIDTGFARIGFTKSWGTRS